MSPSVPTQDPEGQHLSTRDGATPFAASVWRIALIKDVFALILGILDTLDDQGHPDGGRCQFLNMKGPRSRTITVHVPPRVLRHTFCLVTRAYRQCFYHGLYCEDMGHCEADRSDVDVKVPGLSVAHKQKRLPVEINATINQISTSRMDLVSWAQIFLIRRAGLVL